MLYEYTLSANQEDFYNITPQVREAIAKSGIMNGIAVIYCPHTTAGITINLLKNQKIFDFLDFSIKLII